MWDYNQVFYFVRFAAVLYVIINLFFKLLGKKKSGSVTNYSIESPEFYEITDSEQCKLACDLLNCHSKDLPALGFDCEWVTQDVRHPVALIQLASPLGLCYLFRINIMHEVPSELEEILNNKSIIKVGVAPLIDSNHLFNDYNVQVRGTLDLRHLYPNSGGLASLAFSKIGVLLDKSWRLQCSDWERQELSYEQKVYAAKDALVGLEIFKSWLLCDIRNYASEEIRLEKCNKALQESRIILNRLLDIPVSQKKPPVPKTKKLKLECCNLENPKTVKNVHITRKSPLYHNCFMHAPDGELLCSCDKRKADWYVERGLAEVLPGEPYSIRLLFEPAGRPNDSNGGRYYQHLKQNHCVVCGASQSYLKHNVVPKEYRKHFPKKMKDHQSHDIVLMCVECHHLATQHNENLRRKLATLCNAPINGSKTTRPKNILKIKYGAKALLMSGDVMPNERRIFLENQIKQFYEVEELTTDILEKAYSLDATSTNDSNDSHGVNVVKYFQQGHNGLVALEMLWRNHFLKTMSPQYLPALWSVSHNHS